MDARQEVVHLVERSNALANLEEILEIRDGTAALDLELPGRRWMERRAAEMRRARDIHVIERVAVEMDVLARRDIDVEQDVRQHAVALGNHRDGDLAVVEIEMSREFRPVVDVARRVGNLAVLDMERARDGAFVRRRDDFEAIGRKVGRVCFRRQAAEREMAAARERALAHLAREFFELDFISLQRQHAMQGFDGRLDEPELHGAVGQRELAGKQRMRRRARNQHVAVRLADSPFDLVGEHRQQREVSLVERDLEMYLLEIRELLIAARDERMERHDAFRTRLIGLRVLLRADRLLHDEVLDIDNAVEELCLA